MSKEKDEEEKNSGYVWMDDAIMKLINFVCEKPEIWDPANPEHKNPTKAWCSVGDAMRQHDPSITGMLSKHSLTQRFQTRTAR